MNLYHYVQCGLDNVWLRNGFQFYETPYGRGVSFQDVERLHKAIARALADKPSPLRGAELRFLRNELGMSQKRLGELFGKGSQSVAKWEKENQINDDVDYLIRHIYKQTIGGRQTYIELVDHLNELDRQEYSKLEFEKEDSDWRKASY